MSADHTAARDAAVRRRLAGAASEAELSVDPILGWRVWHVRRRQGVPVLIAWTWSVTWPARERIEAVCLGLRPTAEGRGHIRRGHEPPARAHGCGIYALRERADAEVLVDALPFPPGTDGDDVVAIGRVSLWGRVIEASDGWRAQFGYPYELELLGGDDQLAADLRDRYAVDVTRGQV